MVHRIGRVLRLYSNKVGSGILFLSDYRDVEKAGDLLNLLDIMKMSAGFSGGVRIGQASGDARFRSGEIEPLNRQQLLELRKELEASVRSFWNKKARLSLDEVIEILQRKGIRTKTEYQERRKTDPELQDLPFSLPKAYKIKWSEIQKRMGLTVVQPITQSNKPSLKEVIEILKRKGIRTEPEYQERRKTDPELQDLPFSLSKAYKIKWSEIQKRMGLTVVQPITQSNKPSLKEVIEILKRKGIRTEPEYQERRKTDPELQSLPSNLPRSYNLKWSEIKRRMGFVVRITQADKPPLEEVLEILRKKVIRAKTEYQKRRKTDPELQDLPVSLPKAYKIKWSEIQKRMGLTVSNKPSLEEAIQILQKKDIRTRTEYRKQRKTDPELQKLPSNLPRSYKIKWSEIKSLLGDSP